ncbi:MAG TPA: FHA domain-containing protein [Anaeromyxobacteraceae bacterium]|nr:FHA domain-containing protein [Anaeromyxobacteraceae bacterium]
MKTPRQLAIADHLWNVLGRMAAEMGCEREALVNQALHVFARLNGYLVPGTVAGVEAPADDDVHRALEERVLETAAALERSIRPDPEASAAITIDEPPTLYVVGESGELDKIVKERFVIGRGRHCDLVVESAKVSREHAVIVREGSAWFIEDLGSSNGTWYDRERIHRRRIADGDEFFVSSEKIRCVLR